MAGFKSIFLLAIGVALAYLAGQRSSGVQYPSLFEQLRPGLFRHKYDFPFFPTPFVPVPTAVFMVEFKRNQWALVDTGPSTPAWQGSFRAAMSKHLGDQGKLVLILTTHGHKDHSDGLQWVLDTYPDAQLGVHPEELDYLSGNKQYHHLTGDHWKFEVGKWSQVGINTTLDSSRVVTMKGTSGDVANSFTFLPSGILEFLVSPGHTTGHVSFIHKPSKSVITGDILVLMPWTWPWVRGAKLTIGDPFLLATESQKVLHASQKKLAGLTGIDTLFPSHDDGLGVSAEAFKKYAAKVKL